MHKNSKIENRKISSIIIKSILKSKVANNEPSRIMPTVNPLSAAPSPWPTGPHPQLQKSVTVLGGGHWLRHWHQDHDLVTSSVALLPALTRLQRGSITIRLSYQIPSLHVQLAVPSSISMSNAVSRRSKFAASSFRRRFGLADSGDVQSIEIQRLDSGPPWCFGMSSPYYHSALLWTPHDRSLSWTTTLNAAERCVWHLWEDLVEFVICQLYPGCWRGGDWVRDRDNKLDLDGTGLCEWAGRRICYASLQPFAFDWR